MAQRQRMELLLERKYLKSNYTIRNLYGKYLDSLQAHKSQWESVCRDNFCKTRVRWNHGYGKQTIFGKAISKYGWNNFTHEILFTHLTKEEAEVKEIEFIKIYKNVNLSYNDAEGGFCRGKQSERTKELIRQKTLGHKRNLGQLLRKRQKEK